MCFSWPIRYFCFIVGSSCDTASGHSLHFVVGSRSILDLRNFSILSVLRVYIYVIGGLFSILSIPLDPLLRLKLLSVMLWSKFALLWFQLIKHLAALSAEAPIPSWYLLIESKRYCIGHRASTSLFWLQIIDHCHFPSFSAFHVLQAMYLILCPTAGEKWQPLSTPRQGILLCSVRSASQSSQIVWAGLRSLLLHLPHIIHCFFCFLCSSL